MNINRDASLLALRPTTPLIEEAVSALQLEKSPENTDKSTLAHFLHATLRSILKLQHSVIIRLTVAHVAPRKGALRQLSAKEQDAELTAMLKKETSLRMLIIGVVVGHFTEAELTRYLANADDKSEINKRIIELAAKRVTDSRSEVLG